MNFWTFEEDHSQGYYDGVPRKKLSQKGIAELLIAGLASMTLQLFKLTCTILSGLFSLCFSLLGMAIKTAKK